MSRNQLQKEIKMSRNLIQEERETLYSLLRIAIDSPELSQEINLIKFAKWLIAKAEHWNEPSQITVTRSEADYCRIGASYDNVSSNELAAKLAFLKTSKDFIAKENQGEIFFIEEISSLSKVINPDKKRKVDILVNKIMNMPEGKRETNFKGDKILFLTENKNALTKWNYRDISLINSNSLTINQKEWTDRLLARIKNITEGNSEFYNYICGQINVT